MLQVAGEPGGCSLRSGALTADTVEVALGNTFELVLGADGKVSGVPDPASESVLPDFAELPPVAHVAAREHLGCMLTRAGDVWCFGHGDIAQLYEPLHRVKGFEQPVDRIYLRESDAWGRITTPDGHIRWYAWNYGDAYPKPSWDDIPELAGTRTAMCGRRADGAVVCAPRAPAQPGDAAYTFLPKELLPPGTALQLGAFDQTVCARGKTDVWCWGHL